MRVFSAMALLALIAMGIGLSFASAQQRTCYTTRLSNNQSVTRCY